MTEAIKVSIRRTESEEQVLKRCEDRYMLIAKRIIQVKRIILDERNSYLMSYVIGQDAVWM